MTQLQPEMSFDQAEHASRRRGHMAIVRGAVEPDNVELNVQ